MLFYLLFIKKKRIANGVVLMALFAIFFPWTRCRQGKKVFSPYSASLPLSPRNPKNPTQPIPIAYHEMKNQRGQAL
jgi:hypothetical protein